MSPGAGAPRVRGDATRRMPQSGRQSAAQFGTTVKDGHRMSPAAGAPRVRGDATRRMPQSGRQSAAEFRTTVKEAAA